MMDFLFPVAQDSMRPKENDLGKNDSSRFKDALKTANRFLQPDEYSCEAVLRNMPTVDNSL